MARKPITRRSRRQLVEAFFFDQRNKLKLSRAGSEAAGPFGIAALLVIRITMLVAVIVAAGHLRTVVRRFFGLF